MRRRAAAGAAAALLLAGCGGGLSSPTLNAEASGVLRQDVAQVETAARTGSAASLDAAAKQLRADLVAQQRTGAVSSARAAAILAQVTAVLADAIAARPAPTAAPSPTATPRRTPGKHKKGEGGDGGH
jgi:hypothetical protein